MRRKKERGIACHRRHPLFVVLFLCVIPWFVVVHVLIVMVHVHVMHVMLLRRLVMSVRVMLRDRLHTLRVVCVRVMMRMEGRLQMHPVRGCCMLHAREDGECRGHSSLVDRLRCVRVTQQTAELAWMQHGGLRQHAAWTAHASTVRQCHGSQCQRRWSVLRRIGVHGMMQEVADAVEIGRRCEHRRVAHGAHDLMRVMRVRIVVRMHNTVVRVRVGQRVRVAVMSNAVRVVRV